jgi:hypothetical protein
MENAVAWTTISDHDEAAKLLPAWIGQRMIGQIGRFGLLLTTGDVMRLSSITAVHKSDGGAVLLDVMLDSAGVPDGVDLAWQTKHFLGLPVPSGTSASVNLANIVAAVTFTDETSRHEEVVKQLAEAVAKVEEGNLSASDVERSGQSGDGTSIVPSGEESSARADGDPPQG